jgi:hypothetical protein
MSQANLEQSIAEISREVSEFARVSEPLNVVGGVVMLTCSEEHTFAWFAGLSCCPLCYVLEKARAKVDPAVNTVHLITDTFIAPVGLLAFECSCQRVFMVPAKHLMSGDDIALPVVCDSRRHWLYDGPGAAAHISVRVICALFNHIIPRHPEFAGESVDVGGQVVTFTTPVSFGAAVDKYVEAFDGSFTHPNGTRGLAIILQGRHYPGAVLEEMNVGVIMVQTREYTVYRRRHPVHNPEGKPSYNTDNFVVHVVGQLIAAGYLFAEHLKGICLAVRKELAAFTKSTNVWGLYPENFQGILSARDSPRQDRNAKYIDHRISARLGGI